MKLQTAGTEWEKKVEIESWNFQLFFDNFQCQRSNMKDLLYIKIFRKIKIDLNLEKKLMFVKFLFFRKEFFYFFEMKFHNNY